MNRLIWICVVICIFTFLGCGDDEDTPAAEKAGKFIAEQNAKLLKGVGEGLQQEGKETGKSLAKGVDEVMEGVGEGLKENGEATAEDVAEGVGNVLKGVIKGLDKALLQIKVDSHESLRGAGITIEKSEQQMNDNGRPTIITYLKYDKDFKGKVELEVFDGSNVSIEKKTLDVEAAKGETSKAVFEFDSDSKVTFPGLRYTLSIFK